MNNWERDHAIRRLQLEVHKLWGRILEDEIVNATSFQSTLETPMVAQAPGNTIVVTFSLVPADATLTEAPVITSSDSVNAPVTSDPSGLIATVTFPPTAAVGTTYELNIAYTNPDGLPASGSFSGAIVAAVIDVTGFTSAQTT